MLDSPSSMSSAYAIYSLNQGTLESEPLFSQNELRKILKEDVSGKQERLINKLQEKIEKISIWT